MLPAGLTIVVLVVALGVAVFWGLDVLRSLRDQVRQLRADVRELQIRTGTRENVDA